MNDKLLKLVENTRNETAPEVDVADQVMAIIKDGRVRVNADVYRKTFSWMAGLSTAAAITVATLAVFAYYAWTSPLREISETIAWAF